MQEAEESLPYLEGLAKMNCRYIIIGDDLALRYRYAAGNAWFASGPSYGGAAGQDASSIPGDSIELVSYAPNELRYEYSSADGGEVVFSEVYYPVGWSLTVEDTGDVLPIEPVDEAILSDPDLSYRVLDLTVDVFNSSLPSYWHRGRVRSCLCSWCCCRPASWPFPQPSPRGRGSSPGNRCSLSCDFPGQADEVFDRKPFGAQFENGV